MIKLISSLMILLSVSACNMTIEASDSTSSSSSSSTSTVSTSQCSDLSKFSTLVACQLATGSNCTSSVESFTSGGTANCYTPKSLGCAASPPSWQYTAFTVTSITNLGYELRRSLLGCSSDDCICSPAVSVSDLKTTISTLPLPCNTTSCGSYVYLGGLGISGLPFILNTFPVATGVPPISSDPLPTISVSGAPPNSVLKIYSDSVCSLGNLLSSTSLNVSGAGNTLGLAVASNGLIKFYATLTDGTTTTSCSDTQVYYYKISAPQLNQPTTMLVPSLAHAAGSNLGFNFSNPDSNGMLPYSCKYDNTVDNSSFGGSNCSGLPGTVSFNNSSGYLNWQPSSTLNGTYEICVSASNSAGGPDEACTAVYLMNNVTTSLAVTPAITGLAPPISTSTNPTLAITAGAPPSFKYSLYSNSTCTSFVGLTTLDAAGMGSVSTSITGSGYKYFYGKFQDPVSAEYSTCINTGKYYYFVVTPELNDPSPLIFPNNQVKTGFPVTLNFQASDQTGVTYQCFYDQVVDHSTPSNINCTNLLNANGSNATFDTSGNFTWTPPLTAHGAYEFCVVGTQIAAPSPTHSQCTVVDVIPNSLVLTNLIHYYDAQFATSEGGQNSNSNTNPLNLTWYDLKGALSGLLTSITGPLQGWIGTSMINSSTSTTAWIGNGSVASPYAVSLNQGAGSVPVYSLGDYNYPAPSSSPFPFVSGFHEDYVDIGSSTNQSMTVDMWVKVRGAPVDANISLFNNQSGNPIFGGRLCMVAWTGYQFTTASECPKPWCNSGTCSTPDFYQYPVPSLWGGYIMDFFNPANTNDEGMKISVVDRTVQGWDSGGTTYSFSGGIKKPNGTWTSWFMSSAFTYSATDWHHISAIWDQTSLKFNLYIDGQQVFVSSPSDAVADPALSLDFMPSVSRQMRLGTAQSKSGMFKGDIANFRMYTGANYGVPSTNCSAERQRFGVSSIPMYCP